MGVRIRILASIGLVSCWVTLGVTAASATPAHLDLGFGESGISRTVLPPQFDIESFREIAVTAAGGVVTRSSFYSGTELRHYGPEGALASAEPNVKNGEDVDLEPAEATTPEGGRLVGIRYGEEGDGAVSRFRPDGSPDASFGSGGTSEKLPFEVDAVAPLPSGKVLAAGKGVLSLGGTKSVPTYQGFVARLRADGSLDPSFGKEGIAKLGTEDAVTGEAALHVQGRAGEGVEAVTQTTVVALGPSGNLALDFGKGGRLTTPGPAVGAAEVGGEELLVAGTKPTGSSSRNSEGAEPEEFYVARYTQAGQPDPTYAGGVGVATLDPGGEAMANAAVFGTDGSATIGGQVTEGSVGCPPGYFCDRTPVVVRLTPAGLPDGGFGRAGVVRLSGLTTPFQTDYYYGVEALAPRPGGGLFAAGDGNGVTFVAALTPDGSLDSTFGTGGLVTKSGSKAAYAAPTATGTDGAGDIFSLVQTDSGMSLSEGTVVLRYSPQGKLDPEYGEEGKAYVPPLSEGFAVAPDGSVYVASSQTSTLSKLTPAGSLDPSFGEEGSVFLPGGRAFGPAAVTRLADGDLLVAGRQTKRIGTWPAVFRYLPDGELDHSFKKIELPMKRPGRTGTWNVAAMAIDGHGRILLGGSRLHGCCAEDATLIRLKSDGSLDRSFGRDGIGSVGGWPNMEIRGMATRDGSALAAVVSDGKVTHELLYSFRPDGRLDRRFGDGGTAIIRPHQSRPGGDSAVSVFPFSNRIIVVRSGFKGPIVAFSPKGRRERGFTHRLKRAVPERPGYSAPAGPSATLDDGNIVLTWSDSHLGRSERAKQIEIDLQRILLP